MNLSILNCCFLFSHSVMSRLLCLSPSLGVCPNSCPLSQWSHPTIRSSVVPFSSCLQSFPASISFLMNWLFTSGGQSFGASASASVLPKKEWLPVNIQGLFLSGLTGFIPLVSKGLSGVFSSTMVGKNQFCGAQPSLQLQLLHPS